MSQADVIMIICFASAILAGLALLTLRDMMHNRTSSQIRQRLKNITGTPQNVVRQKILQDLERAQAEARQRRRREAMGTLGYYFNRLDTVAGRKGSRILTTTVLSILLLVVLLLVCDILPFSWWSVISGLLLAPLMAAVFLYRRLVNRFQISFLEQLSDAMDMITRASQAGIPFTQSIRNVGEHFSAPLGPEFRRMGDSLLLGNDIQDVMDDAVLRVELADFSFFAVCISLQRSTGGSLVEALNNLAGIIRSRRDLRLKTKAMTAEGRLSGLILTALPFFITAALFVLSPDYILVLFTTEAGQHLLWVAAIMLFLGVITIRKIASMEI